MTKFLSMCVITWVQMLYWLMVKWMQAIVMQCSLHAALYCIVLYCGTRRRDAIRRVLVVGLRCTILTISSCSSTVCIDLRSDDTCTLGSAPHSRNAQNTFVKTARFGVLRNGYLLRYSSTAAFALPLQYPYTKTMSAYSSCVNVCGILTEPFRN